MTIPDLLRLIVGRLEAAGIPHMLTGSLAAGAYGAGRATMDIDLVIDPSHSQLRRLAQSLADDALYVSVEAALEALDQRTMFNVVEPDTGWKVDLIIRKDRAFSRGEFDRRQRIDFEGQALWVASLEDVIIAKLEWARMGGSTRQLDDVTALLRVGAGRLDQAYLDRWLAGLGLREQWLAAAPRAG